MKPNHKFRIQPDSKVKLKEFDPAYTDGYQNQEDAAEHMKEDLEKLDQLQECLFAGKQYSILIILQAMDAAGKDGVIKHVMSGLNPQGTIVTSFKHPSDEEYAHDFFWRATKALPPKGMIGIFNRSYFENALICRVHPELILNENLPPENSIEELGEKFWTKRFRQINNYERILAENGTIILKFFLNISLEEQRSRLLQRIENPDKHWKFQFSDIDERSYWKDYMKCYEEILRETSTDHAPWFVIPADNKWYTRAAIADILVKELEKLKLKFPKADAAELKKLEEAKGLLGG